MSASLHIWITGAGRGIGAAIAHQLGAKHRITLSGRNEASLRQIENMLPGGHAAVVPCDVANEHSVSLAHAAATQLFGPVDVLINNAGIAVFTDLANMTVDAFDDQVAVNLRGVFLGIKSVLPNMLAQQKGMIITINSVAAITAFSGCTGYGASKAGALALSRSLRNEVRGKHIKVADVIVGATETDIWGKEERTLLGERMMQSEDVADAVQMIVSSYSNPRVQFEEILIRPQRGDL
ncbi:MAG TPA: SDR family oxidoreductase [Candidatus Didemnitutus sp.]|nr:SDR family oxidoreductase [Candidatus Didemnitutus sp.]